MPNAAPMNTTVRSILSVTASVILGLLPVYLYYVATSQADDNRLFFEGIFFWYLGIVFILSARYAKQIYLLQAIDYVFKNFAVVGGRYRTLIYGIGFCIVAAIVHYRWLFAG